MSRPRLRRCLTPLPVFLLLASCAPGERPERSGQGRTTPAAPLVDGYVVRPARRVETVVVAGTLRALEETALAPETSGRVVSLHLPEGGPVRQGELLVRLFDDDLQAQLAQARAELGLARQNLTRQSALLAVDAVSQADVDAAGLQVSAAEARLEVLQAGLRQTEVRAPFDGVIGLRQVSLGALISPGTVVATLRRVDRLRLDFAIPERYASQVRPGLQVAFTTRDAGPEYAATVTATEAAVDPSTRTLEARCLVDGAPEGLLPGAYARVTLSLSGSPKALSVPTQALIPQEGGESVIVARGGKAVFVPVRTGTRGTADIEISEGLTAGDTVVITGLQLLKSGAELRLGIIGPEATATP